MGALLFVPSTEQQPIEHFEQLARLQTLKQPLLVRGEPLRKLRSIAPTLRAIVYPLFEAASFFVARPSLDLAMHQTDPLFLVHLLFLFFFVLLPVLAPHHCCLDYTPTTFTSAKSAVMMCAGEADVVVAHGQACWEAPSSSSNWALSTEHWALDTGHWALEDYFQTKELPPLYLMITYSLA